MLEVCKILFSQWNDNQIKYCHWKSNEHLEEGLNGETDLDVYVAPIDRKEAERLLSQCGYIECRVQKGHRYLNVVEWIGFDKSTGKLIHVHLHYQIITGTKYCKEYIFPIDSLIISTRIKDYKTGVFITNPDLELIILFSRISLKASNCNKIQPSEEDEKEIVYLKERYTKEGLKKNCELLIKDEGDDLYNLVIRDNLDYKEWKIIYKIVSKWLAPFRRESRGRVFLKHSYFYCREMFIIALEKFFDKKIVNQKTFTSKALSICFLGQDGSGKSTVTVDLCKWLNWKIEAKRFYLGSGDHYNGLFKRLISLGSRISHRNDTKDKGIDNNTVLHSTKVSKRPKSLKNLISSFIICYYYLSLARRAYMVTKSARGYMNKGGIALFDRFPQNQFQSISDGPRIEAYYSENGLNFRINRFLANKEKKYFELIQRNQPSLIFKLMLPPEESIRRKPFEDYENVKQKHEVIKALSFPHSETHIIDATMEYQKELIIIKNLIWEKILHSQE